MTNTTPSNNTTKIIIIVIIYFKKEKKRFIDQKIIIKQFLFTINSKAFFSNQAPTHPTAPSNIETFAKKSKKKEIKTNKTYQSKPETINTT